MPSTAQTTYGNNHHHYLITSDCTVTLFWGWNICRHKILYTLLWYSRQWKKSNNHGRSITTIYYHFWNAFAFFWGPNKGKKYTLNTWVWYPRRVITQTKHEHKQHHYLLTFHSSCAFFWRSYLCTDMILRRMHRYCEK